MNEIKGLYESWTDEQRGRFEFFVRSHFNRQRVRDVMMSVANPRKATITDEMAIIVSGLAKLYVGELVENALKIQLAVNPEEKQLTVDSVW